METREETVTTKRVYITAEGSHDYSLAKSHGELTLLLKGKINVFASDKLYKDIEAALVDSNPDDHLILSGNMLSAAIAFQIFMEKHGKVNVLIFSFKNELYEVRTIRRGQAAPASQEE